MISVPAPAGASMAYRLDPYSLDVIAHKPKSMHDVVEPTILFYHRKTTTGSAVASPQSCRKTRSPRTPDNNQYNLSYSPSPSSAKSGPRSPAVFSSPTPTATRVPTNSPQTPASVRYITASTITNPCITLIAPFRVAVGDNVVFQTNDLGGEHFGTVTFVFEATYSPSATSTRRLIRKARSADQESQRRNAKDIEAVRSTITAILQNMRPGGFVSSSLSAVEWQLDRSVLNLQVAQDPTQECDLHVLYLHLVKQLRCEVSIITTASPQSSPALSDCGTSSLGEPHCYGDF